MKGGPDSCCIGLVFQRVVEILSEDGIPDMDISSALFTFRQTATLLLEERFGHGPGRMI